MIALSCGVSGSRWAKEIVDPDTSPVHGTMLRVMKLVAVPFFYNACLEVARVMTNPLGTDFEDFPRHAYFYFMWRVSEAFHSTFEIPTQAAAATIKQLADEKISLQPSSEV